MKAWFLDEQTGLKALRLGDALEPLLQPGEALVEVQYAALNPADRYLAERQYPAKPALPHILGRDAVGRILKTADHSACDGAERWAVLRGEVGVTRAGTFAERVAAPLDNLVKTPSDWTDQESAGCTLVYLTAYQALTMWGELPAGAVVLVTGATGGVGVATIQLAKAMGYTVLALSRSAEKSRRLRQIGAVAAFNPEGSQWRQAAKSAAGPHGVDLAVDNIGGKLLPEVIDTLGYGGRVSVVGRLAGPVPEFNTASLFFRRLRIGGVAVGTYTNEESRAAWTKVLELLARTGARPLVDSVFPFEQLPKAFERLAQGPMGKVLLQVRGS